MGTKNGSPLIDLSKKKTVEISNLFCFLYCKEKVLTRNSIKFVIGIQIGIFHNKNHCSRLNTQKVIYRIGTRIKFRIIPLPVMTEYWFWIEPYACENNGFYSKKYDTDSNLGYSSPVIEFKVPLHAGNFGLIKSNPVPFSSNQSYYTVFFYPPFFYP